MKLGETLVKIRIHGPKGSVDVETLVDTGATLTKIQESVAARAGLVVKRAVRVELADRSLKERGLTHAEIELAGQRMTMPILVGPDSEQALLGLTTLELFKLKVNPNTQRLEPSKWIEYALSS